MVYSHDSARALPDHLNAEGLLLDPHLIQPLGLVRLRRGGQLQWHGHLVALCSWIIDLDKGSGKGRVFLYF